MVVASWFRDCILVMAMICPLRHEGKVMRVDLPKKCILKENDSGFRHFADHKTAAQYIYGKFFSRLFIDFKVCCAMLYRKNYNVDVFHVKQKKECLYC